LYDVIAESRVRISRQLNMIKVKAHCNGLKVDYENKSNQVYTAIERNAA